MSPLRKMVMVGVGLALAAAGVAVAPQAAYATTSTYNPVADAYVKQGFPNSNYGTTNPLEVMDTSTGARQSYLKFNITIPAGSTFSSATLTLDFTKVQAWTVELHAVADNTWTETGLTWNNKPAIGALLDSKTNFAAGFVSFNVTQALVNGNNSFMLLATAGSSNWQLKSREDGTIANRPALSVTTTTTSQAAPTTTTTAASGITPTGATLNGTVNPNGAATTCHFDYGTTTAYGTSTASDTSPGSGTTTVNVSAALTGLATSTTYHYRLSCTNAGGTSNGSDGSFTTGAATPPPPTVTTGTASAVTSGTATLNGTVNPQGTATTCHFDWGTTTAYGNATANDTSPGSGSTTVNVAANLTGLGAGTAYHFRLVCSNSGGTTNGTDASFTTSPTDLLTQKGNIYGSEIGAWDANGKPAVDTTTAIPSKVVAAAIPVVRFAAYDCFVGETCGSDNHAGTLVRTDTDNAITGIVTNLHAVPWIKLLPIANDCCGTINGGSFCPPLSNLAQNLTIYKSLMAEIHNVYTGPIVIESTNEGEYDCYATWGYGSPGAVGVSKTLGDHYVANMPALVKYARDTLGFQQVVSVGYVGVSGGPQWGQACTADNTKPYGYACGYDTRWVNEFNTEVHNAYVSHTNDPDYLPNVESMHAYPHSDDFATNPYSFDNNIAYAYYRNWIVQSRSTVNGIWGTTNGNGIRFAVSEWNAGICVNTSTACWSGWSTAGAPGTFYDGWFGMLRGDGNTTGTGTRYWAANLFEIASNSDTAPDGVYNIVKQDGTTPAWYDNFKTASTTDPNR